jgi:hypothetical protein
MGPTRRRSHRRVGRGICTPRPPTDPDVNLSVHPARVVQLTNAREKSTFARRVRSDRLVSHHPQLWSVPADLRRCGAQSSQVAHVRHVRH